MSYMLIQAATAYDRARNGLGTWQLVGMIGRRPVLRYVWPFLILLLTACATQPRVVALKPPAELTQTIEAPRLPEKPTNGDLAATLDAAYDVIDELNRRLRAIRDL